MSSADLDLTPHGIRRPGHIHWNRTEPALVQESLKRSESWLAQGGPLVVKTGQHTGRSPKDRFIVDDEVTRETINWGEINRPISSATFDRLHELTASHLEGRDLFVQDLYAGADPDYRMPVRIVTELAWHSLFARNLFVRPEDESRPHDEPGFTVIAAPHCTADPERHGTRSPTFVLLNFSKRLVLIGGSHYGGEIKKAIFTALNYLLTERDVFPMHCSANVGPDGDVALFFGLSGTGKTTLSTEPHRKLIGDDEHGWHASGVFNFEGGCYAKTIRIKPEDEPEIYRAVTQFGAVLENVVLDPDTREPIFDADTFTENTRGAYPLGHLEHVVAEGTGGIPSSVFMLSFDAFGVLPPIAKLTPAQAMKYFLLGYTAKVAGTERGIDEPQVTFSSGFGAPFLPRPPEVYARMLRERMQTHDTSVWFVNTGITGGPYGVGQRMPLPQTRALIHAALDGTLERGDFATDDVFGLQIPTQCPGVSETLLNPKWAWDDPKAYDAKARELVDQFEKRFKAFDLEP